MVDFNEIMAMTPQERRRYEEDLKARRRMRHKFRKKSASSDPLVPEVFEKRSDVEAAIRRGAEELAKREGLNSEVAFAKFARTDEGRRLKEIYDELPDDEPHHMLPVRKVGPGGTGEIAKTARRIASERGISEEAAYAHLPAELLERHRDELAS